MSGWSHTLTKEQKREIYYCSSKCIKCGRDCNINDVARQIGELDDLKDICKACWSKAEGK